MRKKKMSKKCKPKDRQKKLIVAMAGVIAVLAVVLAYSFVVAPTFNDYVVSKQVEAQDIVLNALLSQLQQNGYIQIPIGEEVLTLVPYQPQQPEA